ncbi:hypothetical protein N0V82_006245 [Gnomoniopsis sp. IMI 355080]|nr:hypothetical protein N0V82_006245 [Gnomoniopsis sp. IMI 355080]
MANLGPPAPPTRVGDPVGFTRTTRDGRRLHYELKVLQQPERARACGSGPKSSADRRPVDPPPVVQMKVFQGPHRENAEDITFAYNADFFLYASLHHDADPSTRVNAQNGPPVLTGLPVSSMILLDRPEEAGYFIFSDLSVRHEGRYYLTFSLMEEVKDDRDKDDDEAMSGTDEITGPDMGSSGRHFQLRTNVSTDVFDVFSAKKFPGLQESTALSRTVAEQGCRVRIRRDVRMRRRGEKGGKKEIAAREDEYAQRAKAEAAAAHNRGRPAASSNDANGPYRQEYGPPRTSFPTSEPSSGRRPTYGSIPPYQSMPSSPSYPPPPAHGAHFPPRPPFPSYAADERSPPPPYAPIAPPVPRDSFSYRTPDSVRGPPMLAPKVDTEMEQKRDVLPPIRSLGAGVVEARKPSYPSQAIGSLPRLMPQPPPSKRDPTPPEHLSHHRIMRPTEHPATLPPLSAGAFAYPRASPPPPLTPSTSRKRSADEAFTAPVDDYRLQNGRRQDDRPYDANYKMELPRYPLAHKNIPVYEERGKPPKNWTMSESLYNRASDNDIPVDFPGLHGQPV